jgi:protein-S-isoprenylcysteine O-methyltransferase Ste14
MVVSRAITMKRQPLIVWTVFKVAIAVAFVGWCALHLRRFDPYFGVSLPCWSHASGVIFMIAGALMILACGGILSTRGIFSMPGERLLPKEFVVFGPFRIVRNPMSLGFVILMLGVGLYAHSVSVLLFALALFLFLHLIVVYVEEPGLERRFGDSYREYKRSVRRWLPRVSGKNLRR